MTETIFTFAGKTGDAFLQWPIAFQWAKKYGKKFTAWVDHRTLKSSKPLFEAQECCAGVELKTGITSYSMGGQPWDFGLQTDDFEGKEIIHLGMRAFPQEQITLQTLKWIPFTVDRQKLSLEPSFKRSETRYNRLVLHGTFRCNAGVPHFWRFLGLHLEDLKADFDEIVFIGSDAERMRALEVYPDLKAFDDKQNMLETARFVGESRLLIGAGSSMVALAGALKVPSIRVHDDIGNLPKVIWSNLGPRQWNETEHDLRKLWPEIRAELSAKEAEVERV